MFKIYQDEWINNKSSIEINKNSGGKKYSNMLVMKIIKNQDYYEN